MTRILLVDFHDSYTYNVRDLVLAATGIEPEVVLHDDPRLAEVYEQFDAVVLSPGPGDPRNAADVGQVPALVAAHATPVLGVCLGHQVLALLTGATVERVRPRHGFVSRLRHHGTGVCAGLPQGVEVVRYHSLAVLEPVPADLVVDAWAEDGTVMALHHRERPWWGVQFHPESICSAHGVEMVRAFARAAGVPVLPSEPVASVEVPEPGQSALRWREIPCPADLSAAHHALVAGRPYSFWLDSALVVPGRSRWSFIGFPGEGEVLVAHGDDLEVLDETGQRRGTEPGGPLAALRRRTAHPADPADAPFPLVGGYVGWLGYEARAELGLEVRRGIGPSDPSDAVWMEATRYLAVDHLDGRAWLVASGDGAEAWIAEAQTTLARGGAAPPVDLPATLLAPLADPASGTEDDPATYRAKVSAAQGFLASGDSYEVCLTTRATFPFPASHAQLAETYRRQRRANPAPYASFLRAGPTTVLSSSPERFLLLGPDGTLETKPIKGTAARLADPVADAAAATALATEPKTRAELLMVVDLLRNDLSRACLPGSVEVPDLMVVESYTSVHQLLSRITGRLPTGRGAVDAITATFPGGSMTGAPKERTLRIIDDLEERRRGIYSGALGWIGADGAADLAIVIRTAVVHDGTMTIGAGGAIVLDSDPTAEHEEMLLKMAAPLIWARSTSVRNDAHPCGESGLASAGKRAYLCGRGQRPSGSTRSRT